MLKARKAGIASEDTIVCEYWPNFSVFIVDRFNFSSIQFLPRDAMRSRGTLL